MKKVYSMDALHELLEGDEMSEADERKADNDNLKNGLVQREEVYTMRAGRNERIIDDEASE